jgi:hypothetical protein
MYSEKWLKKMGIDKEEIKKKYGIDVFLFLDGVALGMSDQQIAELTGYEKEKVEALRRHFKDISSDIGLAYKKDLIES